MSTRTEISSLIEFSRHDQSRTSTDRIASPSRSFCSAGSMTAANSNDCPDSPPKSQLPGYVVSTSVSSPRAWMSTATTERTPEPASEIANVISRPSAPTRPSSASLASSSESRLGASPSARTQASPSAAMAATARPTASHPRMLTLSPHQGSHGRKRWRGVYQTADLRNVIRDPKSTSTGRILSGARFCALRYPGALRVDEGAPRRDATAEIITPVRKWPISKASRGSRVSAAPSRPRSARGNHRQLEHPFPRKHRRRAFR